MKFVTLGLMAMLMSFGANAISGKSAGTVGQVPGTEGSKSVDCCQTCADETLTAGCKFLRYASQPQAGQTRSTNLKASGAVKNQ